MILQEGWKSSTAGGIMRAAGRLRSSRSATRAFPIIARTNPPISQFPAGNKGVAQGAADLSTTRRSGARPPHARHAHRSTESSGGAGEGLMAGQGLWHLGGGDMSGIAERAEIYDLVCDEKILGFVTVSGDRHSFLGLVMQRLPSRLRNSRRSGSASSPVRYPLRSWRSCRVLQGIGLRPLYV